VDAERKKRLAVRTIVVSYRAALRHARNGDRERLRRRALDMLDVAEIRLGPDQDVELQQMLEEARRTISGE
jgi:hypothetical protein